MISFSIKKDIAAQIFKGKFIVLIALLSYNLFLASPNFCLLFSSAYFAKVANIANNMDSDQTASIWVVTVSQSTCLWISRMKRAKNPSQ